MKLFSCQRCGQVLYFENTVCEKCAARLGYLAERDVLSALVPAGDAWEAMADPGRPMRFCDNAAHDACNWLLPVGAAARLCRACQYNRTIPDLRAPGNLADWRKLEVAKHRLIYLYQRLGLQAPTRQEDPVHGLQFDFLADAEGEKVLTGHEDGRIVLALSEADDVERERRRTQMGEPYRTLLGHFRHETGQYGWDVLVGDRPDVLAAYRARFGDETADYGEALQRHYRDGAPADWKTRFVSSYASSHPWEDFAETWAHYLHIVDTLEMASAFDLRLRPTDEMAADLSRGFDAYADGPVQDLIDAWLPLTFAVNSLNRCMGTPDLYPFVLAPAVIEKLGFVHALVHGSVTARPRIPALSD
jgi:hypothetical protein